jgi:hypothetical protein
VFVGVGDFIHSDFLGYCFQQNVLAIGMHSSLPSLLGRGVWERRVLVGVRGFYTIGLLRYSRL